MKTIFTFSIIRTFLFTFIIAVSSCHLLAQTTHNVTVSNYSFNPSQLTINAGDKVVWTNTLGSHNVNGTQATFATNPESFGNSVGSGWTYEYVFNTPGTYSYQCDPHSAMGMTGTVTVNAATAADVIAEGSLSLYPNPASDYVDLLFSGNTGGVFKIYSITGILVDQKVLPNKVQSYRYDLSGLKKGYYFIKITAGIKTSMVRFIKD